MSGAMRKKRDAIAQYEATVVLVVLSLSLASIVYGSVKREASLGPQPVFVDEKTSIGGSPDIERVVLNSSSATAVSSFSVDEASSASGVIAFDGSSYSTSSSLCAAGKTTFFSVDAHQAGTLQVTTDGLAWVSGTWADTMGVAPGWHELMIQGGTSCSVTLPGGSVVPGTWNPSSSLASSIPVDGAFSGTSFTFYVPSGGGPHRLLITSTGGFDDVAL
jgi:hypothetical protein